MRARGFTLIELLVVISIIGLIASIILASLGTAARTARDARRFSDLHNLQQALELYANDHGGKYPGPFGTTFFSDCQAGGSHSLTGASGWIPGLAPTYIPTLTHDPAFVSAVANICCNEYEGTGDGYGYKIRLAANDGGGGCNDPQYSAHPRFNDPTQDGGNDPCSVDGTNYTAYTAYTYTGSPNPGCAL